MKKKIIAGALVALAAGLTTYFYKRRRNRLSTVAANTYDKMDNTFEDIEDRTGDYFR